MGLMPWINGKHEGNERGIQMKLNPGQIPGNLSEIRAYKQVSETKALVSKKLDEMKSLDETPKDIMQSSIGKVVVEDEKFSPHRSGIFVAKERLTGTAEFTPEGEAKSLRLTDRDGHAAYFFEKLKDGTKVYLAPDSSSDSLGRQVVLERPNGTLFVEDENPGYSDCRFGQIQLWAKQDEKKFGLG